MQEKACAALSNLICGDEATKAAVCRLGGVPLLIDVCRAQVYLNMRIVPILRHAANNIRILTLEGS